MMPRWSSLFPFFPLIGFMPLLSDASGYQQPSVFWTKVLYLLFTILSARHIRQWNIALDTTVLSSFLFSLFRTSLKKRKKDNIREMTTGGRPLVGHCRSIDRPSLVELQAIYSIFVGGWGSGDVVILSFIFSSLNQPGLSRTEYSSPTFSTALLRNCSVQYSTGSECACCPCCRDECHAAA